VIAIKRKIHLLPETVTFAGLRLESIVPLCLAMITLILWPHPAAAADGGAGTLTDVANAFKMTSAGWISTALDYARHLFFLLVAIELAWTAVTYALQRDSLSDFVASVVLKLMGVFFFLALLQNAPVWIPYIIESFSQAGANIGGQGVVLDPSSTFGVGLQLAKNMLGTLSNPVFFTAIVAVLLAVFCSIGVVVAYAVVAGQLMVTLIESYIVVSAGLFFLGFSGSRWTLPFSEKYVAYAVSVGIKLFMLYLIVGLGQTLAAQWTVLFTPGVIASPDVYIGVAGSALVFTLLGWQIPSLAASLMNGSPMMTLGTAGSTLGTMAAGGATVVAGGLAATGAVALSGVAAAAALASSMADPKKLEQGSNSIPPGAVGVITGALRDRGPEATRTPAKTLGANAGLESGPATSSGINESGKEGSQAGIHGAHAGGGDRAETMSGSAPPNTTSKSSIVDASADPLRAESPGDASMAGSGAAPNPYSTGAKNRSGPSLRSALDALRSLRIPSMPNDAAGGSIHIRFKHHDAE
jgi:type IV secretion system protein TrbL